MGVSRPIVGAAVASLLVLSAWAIAADEAGVLSSAPYAISHSPKWPLAPPEADWVRGDALRRAVVRHGRATSFAHPPRSMGAAVTRDEPLTCLFLNEPPTGTSAKFDCVLMDGEVIKVKYGRNPEIHAELAAAHLLSGLGYAADDMVIVPRVRCYGCPRYPFFASQVLSIVNATALLSPNGIDGRYTDFDWAGVERKFPAATVETDAIDGWSWWELKDSIRDRADLDAFRLLAVFLAHWDNKGSNQRLVCLDPLPDTPNRRCGSPLLMMQDLGATFGPSKLNLARWRDLPVWADRRECVVSMRSLPFGGATFPDAHVSEEGRLQLARQLLSIGDDDIEHLFREARIPQYMAGTDDAADLEAWRDAFRHRVNQIASAGPCPHSVVLD